MECTGSGVGVRLSDHGCSGLRHPGDCFLGLKSCEGKMKQCGQFVLPGSQDICLVEAVVVWAVPNIPSINTMLIPSFALLWSFIN